MKMAEMTLKSALKEQFEGFEKMYDKNLERMAELQEQIKAIESSNKDYLVRMREIRKKLSDL